jgi:crossover junction endodeoxyribonuclease RuvC
MGTRLSLDPALRCGWALWADDSLLLLACGAHTSRKEASKLGYRYATSDMLQFLRDLCRGHDVTAIAYEKVRFHRGVDAAHVYGALEGVIHLVCADLDIPCVPVEISTWKASVGVSGKAAHYTLAVNALYPLAPVNEKGDEAAAVGVGHCAFGGSPGSAPIPKRKVYKRKMPQDKKVATC